MVGLKKKKYVEPKLGCLVGLESKKFILVAWEKLWPGKFSKGNRKLDKIK